MQLMFRFISLSINNFIIYHHIYIYIYSAPFVNFTSLSSFSSSHDIFYAQVTIKCVQSGVKQPRRWYRAQIPMEQFSAHAQDGLLSRMLAARTMHWCRCHILKLTFKAWCWQSWTDEAQNYRARYEYLGTSWT